MLRLVARRSLRSLSANSAVRWPGHSRTAGTLASDGKMYNWRVAAVNNTLAKAGKAEGPLTVEDLASLGHLDQYHYLGVDACNHLIETLGLDDKATVLDVGSGIGGPARYLSVRSGADITGVELQADLTKAASELTGRVPGLSEKVRFVHGDFVSVFRSGHEHVPAASFDHMISLLVFLHIPDRKALLSACFDAMKPGGTFLIEDFALRGTSFTEAERSQLTDVVFAHTVTSSADYIAALEEAGFTDIHVEDITPLWLPWTKARHDEYRAAREQTISVHGEKIFNDRVAFYQVIDELFGGGNLGGVQITGRKRSTQEEKLVRGLSSGSTRTSGDAVLNELGAKVK